MFTFSFISDHGEIKSGIFVGFTVTEGMKVCRVCLVQDHQEQEQEHRLQFESVFAVREERTVAEIIMLCTGVQVSLEGERI